MLIVDDRRFITTPFRDEDEIENVVLKNYEDIFGPDTILLPKRLIKSPGGSGTIPDAFVVDLLQQQWFIVEVELSVHDVWRHIAPQVAKQLVAATTADTRGTLVETVVDLFKEDASVRAKFDDRGIAEIDVRGIVAQIFDADPIVAIPIDTIGKDLKLWADQLKVEVRLWTIRKLVDFEDQSRVAYEIPDEFRPTVDTRRGTGGLSGITTYDVSLADLIDSGSLTEGQELTMRYRPRGGEQHTYVAKVEVDGTITFLEERFTSLSDAALRGIKNAGSPRNTVNGWQSWAVEGGRSLHDVRADFLSNAGEPPSTTG